MGVFSDFLNNVQTIDTGGHDNIRVGNDRVVTRDIKRLRDIRGDQDYPSGFEARDEVQVIQQHQGSVTGGTFTLSFTLRDGTTFTTAAIAYNANAATIQSAIDAAAAAVVDGWANGDVAVTGGPLSAANLTLTYSGESVGGQNHGEVVINGGSLTGGGTAGDESVTTEGQTNRTSWAILRIAGLISGTPPTQGTSAAVTAAVNRETSPMMPDQETIRALAKEASVEDDNVDVETAILTAFNLN